MKVVGSSVFKIEVGVNAAYDATHAKFSISHTLLPPKKFSIDLKTELLSTSSTDKKKPKPLMGLRERNWNKQYVHKNSGKYSTINRSILSADGTTKVPITVVFNNQNATIESPLNTPSPLVLIGIYLAGSCLAYDR